MKTRYSVPIGRLTCKNGVSLSVQANDTAYCTPREDAATRYDEVEIGFIQADDMQVTPPETWREYADYGFPSDVYAYVPIELVQKFIDDNGGIDLAATLPAIVARSFVQVP